MVRGLRTHSSTSWAIEQRCHFPWDLTPQTIKPESWESGVGRGSGASALKQKSPSVLQFVSYYFEMCKTICRPGMLAIETKKQTKPNKTNNNNNNKDKPVSL